MCKNNVLILGAGASVADCTKTSIANRPPLDKGFFKAAFKRPANSLALRKISNYLKENYAIESLLDPIADSLEQTMAMLYNDIFHPTLGAQAYDAFLVLIQVFNRQLAATTNGVAMNRRRLLYRVIRKQLLECGAKGDLTIITFNQDVQIEKALEELDSRFRPKLGPIFAFPELYGMKDVQVSVLRSVPYFARTTGPTKVALWKLHGSLNWYSKHSSSTPTSKSLFKTNRQLFVTARKGIEPDMLVNTGAKTRKTLYTYPVVVPAVNHKSALLHEALRPMWANAEKSLVRATHVTVFGYSCPQTDFESEHMIARAFRKNQVCDDLVIIDPNADIGRRFVEITGMESLRWFKSATRYLAAEASSMKTTRENRRRTPPKRRKVA